MENQQEYITNYVMNYVDSFRKENIPFTNDQVNRLINRYSDSTKPIEEITKEIDDLVREYLENLRQMQEKGRDARQLDELPLQYNGITLNNQDIDLMLIAGSNTQEELANALSKISNINIDLSNIDFSKISLDEVKEQVFNTYLSSLTSKNDYYANRSLDLSGKVQYLRNSGVLSDSELSTLDQVLSSSSNSDEVIEKLNSSFPREKVHNIYEVIRDFSSVEKSGIKSTTMEASKNLLELIKNKYNSITIDDDAKYGNIVLQDGTFDFRHLQKSLGFVKDNNKQARLNALIFYMDCPEKLYRLDKTEENKALVKQRLTSYVDATAKFVMENGYGSTVRSIDVFNELLNRFPLNSDKPYMYRGDINQEQYANQNGVVDDNVKSGWLKHLDVKDLCDIIALARKNMPNTDFMFNDDNLIDPRKIQANGELIRQIQEYEKEHGVKLIDSIGSQMHIDNDITKEQIREMIINLSQFGLPIEITEFDLAMTKGVENLTDEQIEKLRQEKINDIYDCVEELKEQHSIRGFTIWSKTDKQNFRVSLENEKRIEKGLPPIETLHGGNYTESMQPKNKTLVKNNSAQSFNYHTHTNRCGHAGTFTDEQYVAMAKQNGITQLGFSDHVPFTELEYQDDNQRMNIADVDEYVSSIRKLQQQNPDMKINCGFEAEYDPMKEAYLGELREKVDYMILGQHYVSEGLHRVTQKNNPNYPIEYAKMLCDAMDSGIFDIVAHPDIFMQFRDSIKTDEAKKVFDNNSVLASQMICNKAKEIGIPIELNFVGLEKNQGYPNQKFWQIASESGVQVLYGVDAHNPIQLAEMEASKEQAEKIIDISKLNMVGKDYNPVEARKNNPILQEKFNQRQENALTYETNLITQAMESYMSHIPDNTDVNTMYFGISEMMKNTSESFNEEATKRDNQIVEKIEKISNDKVKNNKEKTFELERAKKSIQHTNETLSCRQEALARANDSMVQAVEQGATTKSDIMNSIRLITEFKTTKKQSVREKISNNMNNGKQNQETKGAQKVLKSSNNRSSSGNKNNGFANVVILSLIVTFICGIAVGIGYMLYKLSVGG